MANSVDFRADQVQVNKVIVKNGNVNSTNCLLIYGDNAQGSPVNQGVIDSAVFPSGAVGTDTFFYVSGAVGARGTNEPGISVFGGDLHISGNLTIDGTYPSGGGGGGTNFFTEIDSTHIYTTSSVRVAELSASLGAIITGSFVQGQAGYVYAAGTNAFAHGGWGGSGIGVEARGNYSHAEGGSTITTIGATFAHAEGSSTQAQAQAAHAEGEGTDASGLASHTEGYGTTAESRWSHAEGYQTHARGDASHTEGNNTITTNTCAHAEGINTTAAGLYSHTEGNSTQTTDDGAHAEGYNTQATNKYAHAEGDSTVAAGRASHAGGLETEAYSDYQTAIGKYNKRNNATSLFVVGDGAGASDALRHDILRVESGSVQVTGSLVSPYITGSIQYLDQAKTLTFIKSDNLITNYNSSGQWEIKKSLYASDGTATFGTGNASIGGPASGASSTFTLSGSANSLFGYTTTDTTAPKVIWTMPTGTRKITLYSRITATDGWTSSPSNRYFEFALKYSGESTPSTVLFGFGINGDDTAYIGDKRTGANQGTGPVYSGVGLFRLRTADTWLRVVWDLEQQVMTYGFGVGTSTSKPSLWRTGGTSYIYATNSTGDWPLYSDAQIVAAIQSFDNTTAPGFTLTMQPEIVVE